MNMLKSKSGKEIVAGWKDITLGEKKWKVVVFMNIDLFALPGNLLICASLNRWLNHPF